MQRIVTQHDIQAALQALNVVGEPVCVHASLRSFGTVAGGATSLRDAFVREHCTLLVPSFSWSFAIPRPPDQHVPRNGWNYAAYAGPTSGLSRIYTPQTHDVDKDMGVLAKAVLSHAQRVRGQHPLCSFTGLGPHASDVVSVQQPDDVYAPLALLAQRKGFVLLIGVSLDTMTLLHLAEKRAGRHLFRRWANDPQGYPRAVEVGGCSAGFTNLAAHLRPITRTMMVGQSTWHVLPAHEVLERASACIRAKPTITHCDNPACERCNDAVAGGPLIENRCK